MKLNKSILLLTCTMLLASCGGGTDDNSINFMVYQPSRASDVQALKDVIQNFTKETGIKVNLNQTPKDKYNSQFNSVLARGTYKPDIAYLDQPSIAKYAGIENGIADITELVGSSSLKLADFNQSILDTCKIGNKLYGLPLNMTASVLFYNKDLVDDADLPTTWADWLALADKVPNKKALFEGIGSEGYAGWYFQGFLKNAGGELYDETTKKFTFNTAEARTTAQFIKDLYRPGTEDYRIRNSTNAFVSGDIMFKIGSSFDVDNIRLQKPEFETKLGAILMPTQSGESHYSVMGGENLVITNVSKKKDKAMKLMEYLMTEDVSTMLSSFSGNFSSITKFAKTDDPVKQVILDQLNNVVARPKVSNWISINDLYLGKALDNILNYEDPKDITEQLLWAETQANNLSNGK